MIHSHLPLQVKRLIHIVMATAQGDQGDVGADGHVLLVLLPQLKGLLQVLTKGRTIGLNPTVQKTPG